MLRIVRSIIVVSIVVMAALPVRADQANDDTRPIACQGTYEAHLQGICAAGDAIYWSFTTALVRTDRDGRVVEKIPVADHHGDLCIHDGKLYVAVNFGNFNDPAGNADSWVIVYDAEELKELSRHNVPQVKFGAGGIARGDETFLVVGGLPAGFEENYVYEYDDDFKFVRKHAIQSGHTHLGIQTATYANGHFWFGCYGEPKILLKTDAELNFVGRYEFDCSLGIEHAGGDRFLIGRGTCQPDRGCVGRILHGHTDDVKGLVVDD